MRMRKSSVLMLLLFWCVPITLCAQVITITKSGSNTWGGSYVPPVWTKSYDLTLKEYKINTQPAQTSVGSGNGRSGNYYSTGHERKSKWSLPIATLDYAKLEELKTYREEKAKETAVKYGQALNSAVLYYKVGQFRSCYNTINNVLYKITSQDVKSNNNLFEVYNEIAKYDYIVEYYNYLSAVKCGLTARAVAIYNTFLSPKETGSNTDGIRAADISKVNPFDSQHYFFLDNGNPEKRTRFENYSVKEHFLADLHFVELLAHMGKTAQGKSLLRSILDFYKPRIDTMEPFLPQIAINHFYLGNVEEASNLLEYYWNDIESYDERLRILNELVNTDDGIVSKNDWSREKNPEQYDFVKRNYQFLDSIIYGRNIAVEGYNNYVRYRLYVDRGNEPELYLNAIAPKFEKPLDSLFYNATFNSYFIRNDEFEVYLLALLKLNDKTRLRAALGRLTEVAFKSKAVSESKVEERIQLAEAYRTTPAVYWKAVYEAKATPAKDALMLFKLLRFAEAGGDTYLREAAKPFLDELSEFTEDEFGYDAIGLERYNIKPRFLKKREYPKTVPSVVAEEKAAKEKEVADKINAENAKIEEKERKARLIAETPLSEVEKKFKSQPAPFGALAMFDEYLKEHKMTSQLVFDSITLDAASTFFKRIGYEKDKSLKADILMASIINDPQQIYGYLSGWSTEKLIKEFYNGPVTKADQKPVKGTEAYEEQLIKLLGRAGQYDQVLSYLGNVSWYSAIKYGFRYTEALAITGKYKDALNFIANFRMQLLKLDNGSDYYGWEYIMRGIVYFYQKDYKESWKELNATTVPNNPVSDPEHKWNFITELYVPRIFTKDMAFYYFCCASELKKKDFSEFLQVISLPMSAPAVIKEKYGRIFTLTDKY